MAVFLTPEKNQENGTIALFGDRQATFCSDDTGVSPRPYCGKHGQSSLGSLPHQATSVAPEAVPKSHCVKVLHDRSGSACGMTGTEMVDGEVQPKQREEHTCKREEHLIMNVSLSGWGALWNNLPLQGLWSTKESHLPINLLELRAIRLAHPHWETDLRGCHILVRMDNIAAKAHLNKQGLMVIGASQGSGATRSVEREGPGLDSDGTYQGPGQCGGRLAKLSDDSPGTVDSQPSSLQGNCGVIQDSGGGPVCFTSQCPASSLLVSFPSFLGRGDERADFSMAAGPLVRISPLSVASESDQEDTLSEGKDNPGGSLVAKEAMVFVPTSHVASTAIVPQGIQGPIVTGTGSSPGSTQTSPDRMAIERQQLLDLDLSAGVTSTILSSRHDSTIRIYNHMWRTFHRWCSRRRVDPLLADHRLVLEFL